MNNNKIAPALARVMPARPNPAGNAGANQAQRQMAVVRPVAPIQVVNGQMPANGNAALALPSQQTLSASSTSVVLESKTMGGRTYDREADKLTPFEVEVFIPTEMLPLLGDGTKVSLHRVHNDALAKQGAGDYEFIGRDPHNRGKALVSVEATRKTRGVYEVTFNFNALPLLAKEVSKAPKL